MRTLTKMVSYPTVGEGFSLPHPPNATKFGRRNASSINEFRQRKEETAIHDNEVLLWTAE